jgi:hypothetical protein
VLGVLLAVAAMANVPPATGTDFGVRELDNLRDASVVTSAVSVQPIFGVRASSVAGGSVGGRAVNIAAIAAIGSAWGRVTSTYRSPERNRRVGGVRNSFHLSGRAIDIARRPGVSHSTIAAAYRGAGYQLVESLDEGDHSHFAFGSEARRTANVVRAQVTTGRSAAGTQWKIVSAPR